MHFYTFMYAENILFCLSLKGNAVYALKISIRISCIHVYRRPICYSTEFDLHSFFLRCHVVSGTVSWFLSIDSHTFIHMHANTHGHTHTHVIADIYYLWTNKFGPERFTNLRHDFGTVHQFQENRTSLENIMAIWNNGTRRNQSLFCNTRWVNCFEISTNKSGGWLKHRGLAT